MQEPPDQSVEPMAPLINQFPKTGSTPPMTKAPKWAEVTPIHRRS
jgi:hypothetical protein